MFRRRTDQVYATLQQVQRRITEQAPGTPAPTAERSGTVPPFGPLQEALQRQKAPQPVVGHQPEPPPPPALAPMPTGRIILPLTVPFALTITVLWIVSCVFCFVLGQHERERRTPSAAVGFAAGDAGNREAPQSQPQTASTAPVAKPLGPDLLVLTQVATATPEMEQAYRQRAEQLNKIMADNASRGWKPWFGVRKPSNGSLQLVFGEVAEGVYGVTRKDFDDFARMLAQPPKKGAGYATAIWVNAN